MRLRVVFIYIIFIFILSSCRFSTSYLKADKPIEADDFLMGTLIEQRVYGKNAQAAIKEVKTRLKEIESLMTINASGGDVNSLNEAAGRDEVALEKETIKVLYTAKKYAELSNGAFDVTVGPLVKAWGVFTGHPRVPAGDEIDRLLKLVDYRKLHVDVDASKAKLEEEGQIADLGGIAKGYAGDEAIRIYKKQGISSAYINLGGNVVVLGNKPDGTPWRIGIQNPIAQNGSYVCILDIADKAVVTSGDYERYFEKDGKRYHHIIDPDTGFPAESGLASVSIVTNGSIDADALSTAAFVLGLEKGRTLIEGLEGVEAVFITKSKEIYITEGLKGIFTLSDESKDFKYVEER